MKLMVTSVVVAGAMGMLGMSALANTISLDTFEGSGWTVDRTPLSGSPNMTEYHGAVKNVTSIPGNGGTPGVGTWYTFPGDKDAKWVAWTAGAGVGYSGDKQKQEYVYTRAFSMADDFSGPGYFTLSATMAMDNWVRSISLTMNGMPVAMSITPSAAAVYGSYTETDYVYTISASVDPLEFNSSANFLLQVVGVNQDGNANPTCTGFIMSGEATAFGLGGGNPVPLPAAAWTGLTSLLGIGATALLRKRSRRAARG